MASLRRLLSVPLVVVALAGTAAAASIVDKAGMFSADAVRKAEAELNRIERQHKISTTIETIDTLGSQTLIEAARHEAEKSGAHGLFILIPKKEHKIEVLSSRAYSRALNGERVRAIREGFIDDFKAGKFDEGLLAGVGAVDQQVAAAHTEFPSLRQGNSPPAAGPVGGPMAPRQRRGSGIGSLLFIGLLIVGGLFLMRILGSLFGGGYARTPGQMMGGGPGYGMGGGFGPGYGGGRGGGFWSSMLGGIGGAMAGNWMYDQFSGRHSGGQTNDAGAYNGGYDAPAAGDDWSSGASAGGDWGGGDTGGGDWGGGGGDDGVGW